MTVNFDIEVKDMLAYQKYFLETNRDFKRSMRGTRFTLPILMMAWLGVAIWQGTATPVFIVFLAGLSILYVIFTPKVGVWLGMSKAKKILGNPENTPWRGPQEVTMSGKGVHIRNNSLDKEFGWGNFPGFAETDGYFFLFGANNSAYIIPKAKLRAQEITGLRSILSSNISRK